MTDAAERGAPTGQEIAVVGMAGRFPGAGDLDAFWRNLREGVGSISRLAEEELAAAGVSPREFRAPGYVPAAGVLEGAELFDASFFGFTPREASILNPQHRVFLECAWEALERAGYATDRYRGRIGVYAAAGQNRYLLNVLSQPAIRDAVGDFQAMLWNADSIATLTSYRLDLRGPSINLQTACSSSLVAVHLACQSLLFGECDMTLAGGIHIAVPQRQGYRYSPGGILSPTGECRSFDADARGTVGGSGVGVVVLKRLEDALADGDTIHAVIRGSAVNNDGAEKAGYTVPRREGQAEVVAEALAMAGVEPEEVSYVEAHGSGTEVGDPIEVAALATAFGDTERTGYCALGSVKSNVGHLDAAAGIAGLIKTVLALEHGEIPPSLHFQRPNPRIDFARSPFFVNAGLRRWERDGAPRRAGVSSFGMGGTNVHVVLEEAPEPEPSGGGRPWELLVLSARTRAALEASTDGLAAHLAAHPEQALADVAHTLRVGRRRFGHRRVLVCRDRADAAAALAAREPRRVLDAVRDGEDRPVAFLFPGVGDHYAGMARGLYEAEPVFRREVDGCAEILLPLLGHDLRGVLFPGEPAPEQRADAPADEAAGETDLRRMLGRGGSADAAVDLLARTELAHPALFVVEYALARTWLAWGVRPEVMLGHSLGEYVAATVAGVFRLEDALALVAERARLVAGLPEGAMLAVPLPEEQVVPLVREGLAVAAVNAPEMCTVSGIPAAIAALEAELTAAGVACRRLNASHAFHSSQMEPVARALAARVRGMRLSPPELPFLSNVTGRLITADEAVDPEYWARHLCRTVRFADGLRDVLSDPRRVLLEVGPGRALGTFALQVGGPATTVLASLRHAYTRRPDLAQLLETAGALWMAGARLDWIGFAGGERRLRVPLPTYPFEHQAYWIERRRRRRRERSPRAGAGPAPSAGGATHAEPLAQAGTPALHARPELGVRYAAPEGETQRRLAGIWQELLGFEIGAHDDFFSLGGHSLMATRVLFQVREAFGVELPLEAVFEDPTVAGLAARVDALREAGGEGRLPPIVRVPRAGPLPLSYAQERLWVLDQLEPGSPLYNVPGGMRIHGRADLAVAHRALLEIVRRHEVLRTVYREVDGAPVQVVLPETELPLPVDRLEHVPEEERPAVARARLQAEAKVPFALDRGPVMRTRVLRFAEDDHVLLITLHHIAVDGWSWGLMFHEWNVLYAAFSRGEPSPLPELPVQYGDYAVWQRGILSGERLREHLAYWRETLRGAPTVLEVPTDRPHPPVQSYRGALYGIELAPEALERVRDLARAEGATLHLVFFAAFQALLFRYTGQEDFLVGSAAANRLRPETQRLLGFFINTVPVRARLSPGLPFRALLDRVRVAMLGVYAHAELPLQMILEEVQPERDPSRNPLVQVMMVFQTPVTHGPEPERPTGLTKSSIGDEEVAPLGDSGTSKFDLSMLVDDGTAGPATAVIEYNLDLYDRATIERFAEHYRRLLEAMAADPGSRLSEVSLLREAERDQVLRAWNDTARPVHGAAGVHDLFAAQAARTPDAVALAWRGEPTTYAALDRRSALLAGALRRRGVGPETRVGVCMARTPELVASLLAVLRAGGAYVPMDPGYPAERLRYMLADSGAALLLADSAAAERLGECGVELMVPDGVAEHASSDGAALSHSFLDSLAYVVYTSGSTGTPKGVLGTHRGALNRFAWMWSEHPFAAGEVCCQKTSLAFVDSVWEMFGPLLAGVPSVLVPDEDARDAEALVDHLARHGVTRIVLVPSLLGALLDAHPELGARCPRLRLVVTSGEELPAGLARRFAEALPGATLLNLYGSSEVAADSTHHALDAAGPAGGERVPIGRPIWNTRVYVADAAMQPLPPGAAGELYVAGAGVARGYMGNPAATAERFVPDPFASAPGERMYRTGDRARWTAGGELEYLGRTDQQVKVRGFRIELGEIEAALRSHPAVRDAAAGVRADARGERRIVGYVAAEAGAAPSAAELRAHLAARLPEHMVPGALVVLERLPLNANGKVDRRALPAPDFDAGAAHVAPRTRTEAMLAGIWAEVLGVERVGTQQGFFDLGGQSLLATRVISRARAAFGVELPMRALLEAPTVAALAARIEALRGDGAGGAPPLRRVPRDPWSALPLSFAQQRLWIVDRLEPESAAYNMRTALRLRGALNVGALRGAQDALVRRHESLRTVFREQDGAPVQIILAAAPVALPVLDLGRLAEADREAEARRLATREALRPFDLGRGPLLRGALLRLGETDHVLCFTQHHIISDGWSSEVMVREISALYGGLVRGEPARLPELPIQYGDYAVWQRSWLTSSVLEEQLGYWRERLAGVPPLLEVPTDRPRSATWDTRAGAHRFVLPSGVSRELRALARREGATLFMAALAGWQALLGRYAGQEDLVVGSAVAGRTQLETEALIGFFVNMLVFRCDLGGDPSVGELLGRVREGVLGAYAHQELPFERLVDELGVERSPTHAPLVQAAFALQRTDGHAGELRLGEMVPEPFPVDVELSKFDLDLTLSDEGEELVGTLLYRRSLFEADTAARMAAHLAALLEGMAADRERHYSALPLLRDGEYDQLLAGSRAGPCVQALDHVHALVSAQAARTPGLTAVAGRGAALTYAELERSSNRLAHHLRTRGVGPEVRVGLCLDRGVEVVVGVLAILKAGGAYVPLDPELPAERIAYMLEDAAPELLLTQAALAGRLEGCGVPLLCVDAEAGRIERESEEPPLTGVGPHDLAYVIYTSGSTGRPKGVAVEHASLANTLLGTREAFGLAAGEETAVLASYAFDIWGFEVFTPLLSGGTVRLLPRGTVRDVERLVEELGTVEAVHAVPALMREIVARVQSSGGGRLPRMRRVFVGGDAIAPDLLEQTQAAFPAAQVWAMYGPTENTMISSATPLQRGERYDWQMVGRPLPGVGMHVVDPAGNLLPVGVPGELCLAGAGVARGYLGRADATAERFVPDPFSGVSGARLYRTGDRVRRRADGELEFLGRVDAQVKIRGFRVEPGEVEAVLLEQEEVHEAVVTVREDAAGQKRLVGYVVAEEGVEVTTGELRARLSTRLPEHMVPAALVVLERLPLTATGKVDRRALPAPERSREGRYEAARTEVEEVLCGTWAEVLGVERVGVRENFFELGGHSLLATRVVARIREVLAVELPLRELFDAPTVAGLAERVEALRRAGQPALPPVVPTGRTGALPLSFAQQRLWVVDRLEPGSAAYNMPFARRLFGVPDVGALQASVDGLARRHETLRTTFEEQGGVPVQVVHPPAPVELPMVDLGGLPAAAREPEALRLAGEEALRPFDLARGPLMRSTLLRLDAEDHVLLFTLHHIVSDGWSMGVLARDVTALYAAHAHGEEPALPVLPVQYADHALWQRATLRGEELDRQLAWWRERLAGAPALLELPADRPRPAVQGHRGAVRSLRIDAATAGELRALCRHEGVTTFMALLAGFAVLLGRYSGQADVVVGAPAATRGRRETEGLIGFFLNTLALRTDLSGDPSFRELLGRVREMTLGAYVHQDLPFERILEELQPARTLSHSPLFQVMLNLQNFDDPAPLDLAGVRAEPFGVGAPAAKYDLTLYAGERDGGIRLDLVYNADLFEDARMEDALGHLRTLFAAVAADPELRVSRIPLLTEEERRARAITARGVGGDRVFAEFARTETGQTIPARFERQVRLHPDRLALQTRTTRLTYAGLDRAADALARAVLRARPAGPERIALLFEHDAPMIVGMLGVLKAGKTYVPVDPLYPRERSAWVLEDSGAAALVTNHANLALARELAGDGIPLVVVGAEEPAGSSASPALAASPDDPAYILYTSGSTGRPKGVVQSHRNVLHFIRVYTNNLRIGSDDRLTLFSSYTFDAAVMATYGALLNGAALFPFDWREEAASGIAGWMRRERITVYHSTPTVFRHLVGDLAEGERFPDARLVVLGGEEAQRRDVEAFRRHFPADAALVNGLGPTESTVTLQAFLGHDTPVARNTVPLGHPVEDTEVELLGALGEQVAVYGVGEIVIRSPHVALGYWRRPDQTAAFFADDADGVRSYRTGDLGRRLPDGSLEFMGRTDFQVKVRGFRIEPGEVEEALRSHPAVRDAVVAAREDGSGERRLAGYVVPAGEETPDAGELRAHLLARLPGYMVPAAFTVLGALPLTPSGKVDRLALPAPEWVESAAGAAPRTPTEVALAAVWAEMLGREDVGAEDDFFALGGHSLLATRVVSRVRNALGVELPLRALFEAPTLARLAARVDLLLREGAGVAPPIVRVPRDRPLPLSFAQQRLWFIDQLEPESAAYNIPTALRLRGRFDPAVLERSLTEIVRRHEMLRTVFAMVDGEPVQVIRDPVPVALPITDLQGLPAESREAEVRRLAWEEAVRPFDLAAGPLLRVSAVRLDEAEWGVLFTMHHIVSDGWSIGVLIREVSALYGVIVNGREARLPELPVQYADYAAWQRGWLTGEAQESRLGFWRERLRGSPPLLELPTDRPRPQVQDPRGGSVAVHLPEDVSRGLRALARREGVTAFMALLAAWQLLLSRYSGQEDVSVGTPIAGRTRLETEPLIGFFVNTLVLRTDLSGGARSATCWGGCGRRRWERTSTRRSPSSAWWRSLRRSGAWRTRRSSR